MEPYFILKNKAFKKYISRHQEKKKGRRREASLRKKDFNKMNFGNTRMKRLTCISKAGGGQWARIISLVTYPTPPLHFPGGCKNNA